MDTPRAKILVVDDDANLLDLLTDTLTSIGYETESAKDGIEALDRLKKSRFDLMITDIKMPNLDGVSLLRRVRRYYPHLPVLFITGYETPEIIGRASADGFLAKPFRISHIEDLIEQTLKGQEDRVEGPIRRIMVVDDDHAFRETLTDMLVANDYIPIAVSNAHDALRELENGEVDAVITDIRMPEMDGMSLLDAVKAKYPDLPVILITAFLSPEDAGHNVRAATADGFLRKPFRAESIIGLLKKLAATPA